MKNVQQMLTKAKSWLIHMYMKSCTLRSNTFSTCWTTLRHFCTMHDCQNKKINKSNNWTLGRPEKSTHTLMHLVASQTLILSWLSHWRGKNQDLRAYYIPSRQLRKWGVSRAASMAMSSLKNLFGSNTHTQPLYYPI